ncbi:MAG: hypothetical protein JO219_02820 [Candidatus Eremiobacteraeota bacterium]|nr:hypothetical protein [Candidatus Eremiobacteraeota bacterium]
MTTVNLIPIAGTHRIIWPGTTQVEDVSPDTDVWLTAWLRPKRGGELDVERARTLGAMPPAQRRYLDRAQLSDMTTADPADIQTLQRYCAQFGIEMVATHWRSVVLSGSLKELIKAFGATVAIYEAPDKRRFRHRAGSLHAPAEIAEIVQGLFGFHEWPRSHAIGALHAHLQPLSAAEVVKRYQFPEADGSGETIGVLQLRGAFKPDDFTKCMQDAAVKTNAPFVRRIDNAEVSHAIETDKDIESAIDTQIVGALAPGAQMVIYAAPDNERGVLDAVRTALFDADHRPSILSISFGFPEHLWTPAALTILDQLFTAAALIGVSVFCASGDNGAELDDGGKPHVLAPASSPFAHGCGGTAIADTSKPEETAWEKTGGGFSERFDAAPWQGVVNSVASEYKIKAGRGVPDFAAQVKPGYTVFFDGVKFNMGGTSAVAPMWSALAARLNQRIGKPIGFFAPLLYGKAKSGIFRDVTSGANDRFRSGPGWNPCTGLGVPIGTAIERALRG